VFTAEDSSSIPSAADRSVSSNRSYSDISFTQQDVLNVLMKLRADKADGPDELSARFLIQVREHIVYKLFTIFRKSLDEGFVPDDWKSANISSVFKKGNRNIADNYRPVSLTSQIFKVFETIIRDSVVPYLEDNSTDKFTAWIQKKTVLCYESSHIYRQSYWLLGLRRAGGYHFLGLCEGL